MKIAFVMIAFNSDYVLEPCLRSIAPYGKIYAAEGPVAYWQNRGFETSTDRTNELLDKYAEKVVHGRWSEKDEEANAALALVPDDVDHVWVVDTDEIWRAEDIERIISTLEAGTYDTLVFKPWSFYGGFDRYMTGFEESFQWRRIMRFYPGAKFSTHRPPTISPQHGRKEKVLSNAATDALGWRMFHYSYVFPSQIKDKTDYYHSWSKTIPGYFERVYLPWVLGDDAAKQRIEYQFDGVHDWLPERRGACRTAPFTGEHPKPIRDAMQELLARFDLDLEQWKVKA